MSATRSVSSPTAISATARPEIVPLAAPTPFWHTAAQMPSASAPHFGTELRDMHMTPLQVCSKVTRGTMGKRLARVRTCRRRTFARSRSVIVKSGR